VFLRIQRADSRGGLAFVYWVSVEHKRYQICLLFGGEDRITHRFPFGGQAAEKSLQIGRLWWRRWNLCRVLAGLETPSCALRRSSFRWRNKSKNFQIIEVSALCYCVSRIGDRICSAFLIRGHLLFLGLATVRLDDPNQRPNSHSVQPRSKPIRSWDWCARIFVVPLFVYRKSGPGHRQLERASRFTSRSLVVRFARRITCAI